MDLDMSELTVTSNNNGSAASSSNVATSAENAAHNNSSTSAEMSNSFNLKEFREKEKKVECFKCAALLDRKASKLLRCSGCRLRYYCSGACQLLDWNDNHKNQCPTLAKLFVKRLDAESVRFTRYNTQWGNIMEAARDMVAGVQIFTLRPMFLLLSFSVHEITQDMDAGTRHLLLGKAQNYGKEGSVWSAYNYERYFKGLDHNQLTMVSRLAFIVLSEAPEMMLSRFFNSRLTGSKEERTDFLNLAGFVESLLNKLDPRVQKLAELLQLKEAQKAKEKRDRIEYACLLAFTIISQNFVFARDYMHESQASPIGMMFDPRLALINHSCKPNAEIVFSNGHASLFALTDIKEGEQIFVDYLMGANMLRYHQRRLLLLVQHHFPCACLRCEIERNTPGAFLGEEFPPEPSTAENMKQVTLNDIMDRAQEGIKSGGGKRVRDNDEKETKDEVLPDQNQEKTEEDDDDEIGPHVPRDPREGMQADPWVIRSPYCSPVLPDYVTQVFKHQFQVHADAYRLKAMILTMAGLHRTVTEQKDFSVLDCDAGIMPAFYYILGKDAVLLSNIVNDLIRYESERQFEWLSIDPETKKPAHRWTEGDRFDGEPPEKTRSLYLYFIQVVLQQIETNQRVFEKEHNVSVGYLINKLHIARICIVLHPYRRQLKVCHEDYMKRCDELAESGPKGARSNPQEMHRLTRQWIADVRDNVFAKDMGSFELAVRSCQRLAQSFFHSVKRLVLVHKILSAELFVNPLVWAPYCTFIDTMCEHITLYGMIHFLRQKEHEARLKQGNTEHVAAAAAQEKKQKEVESKKQ